MELLSSDVLRRLEEQAIEVPSWAFGNSGTRFKVFAQPGVPRDPFEKLADAAQVHAVTGLAPSVALHIPWDEVDDFAKLGEHAESLGLRLGTINSNTFQDDDVQARQPGAPRRVRSASARSTTTSGASRSCTRPDRPT